MITAVRGCHYPIRQARNVITSLPGVSIPTLGTRTRRRTVSVQKRDNGHMAPERSLGEAVAVLVTQGEGEDWVHAGGPHHRPPRSLGAGLVDPCWPVAWA